MAPPTWRWTYESTKYSIEQEQQQKKNTEKSTVLSIPWKGAGKHLVHHFYYLEGKEFGSLGANPFFWPMWDGGYFAPSLDSQEAFTSMAEALVPFWGGWRPIDSPGPALEETARKLGG